MGEGERTRDAMVMEGSGERFLIFIRECAAHTSILLGHVLYHCLLLYQFLSRLCVSCFFAVAQRLSPNPLNYRWFRNGSTWDKLRGDQSIFFCLFSAMFYLNIILSSFWSESHSMLIDEREETRKKHTVCTSHFAMASSTEIYKPTEVPRGNYFNCLCTHFLLNYALLWQQAATLVCQVHCKR